MKKISYVLFAISVILSYIAVGAISYSYARMECAIAHMGASAPANVVFYTILPPYLIIIIICIGLGIFHYRRSSN